MRIRQVYTGVGDRGTTRLVGGAEIAKDAPRVEAYGSVDELNSVLAVVRADPKLPAQVHEVLERVQHMLFTVGGELATPPDARWGNMILVSSDDARLLEQEIDAFNDPLPALKEFVLPGGGLAGANLHLARTVCRRAERRVQTLEASEPGSVGETLIYLNRLSDLLFVLARWCAMDAGVRELMWRNPNARER